MKNRNVLFGYCYRNGEITIHEKNADTLKYIREAYLSGKSLLQISEILNEKSVEYTNGVVGWNKSRIMRLLSERKYLGNKVYPATIDKDTFETIQKIRISKNTQKNTDRKKEIYTLSLPIYCTACGSLLKRHIDPKRDNPVKWYCKNPRCKTAIAKSDESLLNDILNILNRAIEFPDIINLSADTDDMRNEDPQYTEETIADLLKSVAGDEESVRKKLLESAALRYEKSDSERSRNQKLKDIFAESQKQTEFSCELLNRTANSIKLYDDGTVGLILENGQEINTRD